MFCRMWIPQKFKSLYSGMFAKSLRLCWTLCNTMNCSEPGSSVLGIFQARTLYWVAISSSSISSTQGLNPHPLHLLHCRWILYQLSHTSDKSINGIFFNMKLIDIIIIYMKSFLFVHSNYGHYMYSLLDLMYGYIYFVYQLSILLKTFKNLMLTVYIC